MSERVYNPVGNVTKSAHTGLGYAQRLLQQGVTAFPLQPLRTPVLAKLGPCKAWALIAAVAYLPVAVSLLLGGGDLLVYAGLGVAALGIFLCNWGSILGLKILLDSSESFESVLEGEPARVRDAFVSRFCPTCSLTSTAVGGLIAGVLITGALYLQNASAASTAFARSFAGHGYFYVLVFVSAFGIGVGHVCMFCLLRLVLVMREFRLRKLHSVVRVYDLSRIYLRLASISLAVYANYLLYLYFMWLGGVRFSFLVNALAAVVGAGVLIVYFYPQVIIHAALKANRRRLVDEAIAHLERIAQGDGQLSLKQQEEIVQALDYLNRVQEVPTWGFRLRELTAIFFGYVIPLAAFLEAQSKWLLSLF